MDFEQTNENASLRERLITAGIEEIAAHGIANFSLRRVAMACGASCAAPYRHFKNRRAFIAETVRYINGQWGLLADKIIHLYDADKRTQLVELCVAFIRFLFANDNYRSVLAASGEHLVSDGDKLPELLATYCERQGADHDAYCRMLYTMRALVYGTVAMLENGELTNCPATFDMVRAALGRDLA